MTTRTKWNLCEQADASDVSSFSKEIDKSEIFARLCLQRGIDTKEKLLVWTQPDPSYLHDPYLFYDMDRAVERITHSILEGEKITIYGDYDADGVTSTALLVECLDMLGAEVDYYIPSRFSEGYGPNIQAFQKLMDQGTQLIITCDNGVQGHESISLAQDAGVDVIVTDHHELPEQLPEAYAIIHPRHPKGHYPFGDLAGVGVAFKLAHALLDDPPLDSLDLVAIGTVADLVSLTDENHVLVKYGLQVLSQNQRISLQALYEKAKVNIQHIDETTIAFQIAPRLNAVGRMAEAKLAVAFLLSQTYEEAYERVEVMEAYNQERKSLTDKIEEEALSMLTAEGHINIVAKEGWHEGVLGIVASRLVEKTGKASLVLTIREDRQIAKGSGRSVGSLNLYDLLNQAGDLFDNFGGHAAAAGMSLSSTKVDELRDRLNHYIANHVSPEELEAELKIDMSVDIEDLSMDLVQEISLLKPYGTNHSSPRFLFKNLLAENMKKIGRDQKHLKFCVGQKDDKVDCVAFGRADIHDQSGDLPYLDLVGQLDINEWNGVKKLQVLVDDVRLHPFQVIDKRGLKKRDYPLQDSRYAFVVFNRKYYDYLIQKEGKLENVYHVEVGEPLSTELLKEKYLVFLDMPTSENLLKDILIEGDYSHLYPVFQSFEHVYLEGLAKREDFSKVYKYLASHQNVDSKKRDALARYLKMSVPFLNHILFVFIEAGYVTIQDGMIVLDRQVKGQVLEETRAYQKRKEQLELEEKLLYSSIGQLTQLLKEWGQEEHGNGFK